MKVDGRENVYSHLINTNTEILFGEQHSMDFAVALFVVSMKTQSRTNANYCFFFVC